MPARKTQRTIRARVSKILLRRGFRSTLLTQLIKLRIYGPHTSRQWQFVIGSYLVTFAGFQPVHTGTPLSSRKVKPLVPEVISRARIT